MSRIVVGYDGSAASDAALRWAYGEAKLRSATLQLVHAWSMPMPPAPWELAVVSPESIEEAADGLTEEALARLERVLGRDLDVVVDVSIVEDAPGKALVRMSEGADMVVVGSHDKGAFTAALLGSVSRYVTQHAHVPVVVVHEHAVAAPELAATAPAADA